MVYKIGRRDYDKRGTVGGASDGAGRADVNSPVRKTQEYVPGGISPVGWPRSGGGAIPWRKTVEQGGTE
jgi:hypothetical protein